jgi:hypothetical protein
MINSLIDAGDSISQGSNQGVQATTTANELAEQRTDLAIRRTIMAADRSLMAWIRNCYESGTSTSGDPHSSSL